MTDLTDEQIKALVATTEKDWATSKGWYLRVARAVIAADRAAREAPAAPAPAQAVPFGHWLSFQDGSEDFERGSLRHRHLDQEDVPTRCVALYAAPPAPQAVQQPLTASQLGRMLVRCSLIDEAAIDDPEGYDEHRTTSRLERFAAALAAAQGEKHADPS
jgi:hypothetical protein